MPNATARVPVTLTWWNDPCNYWPIPATAKTYYPGEMLGIKAADGKAYSLDDSAVMSFAGIHTAGARKIVTGLTPSADLYIRTSVPFLFGMKLETGTASRLLDRGKKCFAVTNQTISLAATTNNNLVGYVFDILPANPLDLTSAYVQVTPHPMCGAGAT